MTWGIFKADGVSEAYKKMKSCATEELKGDQHKLDVNKNGKVDGEDLAKLRATKKEDYDDETAIKKVKKESLDELSEEELQKQLDEVLSKDQPAGKWISDFVKSDDPKFAGDTKKQRIKRALGAYYAAKRNESTDYAFFAQYLDEEASIVKKDSKEIKHANVKSKQSDREEMETHSETEQKFVDAHELKVEEDPAKAAGNDQSGKEKVGKASEPKGQGPAKYDADSKLSDKDKAKITVAAEAVIKTDAGEEIDTEPQDKKKKTSKQ